eukprot:EG_transcript_14209
MLPTAATAPLKPRWEEKQPLTGPGPGSYSPDVGAFKQHAPAAVIPKATDPAHSNPIPGPGDYNPALQRTRKMAPAFSFRKAQGESLLAPGKPLPGPADYSPSPPTAHSPGYFMGVPRQRPPPLQTLPGPGAHHVEEAMDKVLTRSPSYRISPPKQQPPSLLSPLSPKLSPGARQSPASVRLSPLSPLTANPSLSHSAKAVQIFPLKK